MEDGRVEKMVVGEGEVGEGEVGEVERDQVGVEVGEVG